MAAKHQNGKGSVKNQKNDEPQTFKAQSARVYGAETIDSEAEPGEIAPRVRRHGKSSLGVGQTMKALLLHVGVDSTNVGVSAPIFKNRAFQFVPIPEMMGDGDTYYMARNTDGSIHVETLWGKGVEQAPWLRITDAKTYSDLEAHSPNGNGQMRTLKDYVPSSFANIVVHHDPDFRDLTYGDRIDDSRGKQLPSLEPGDILAFVESLAPHIEQAYSDPVMKGRVARFQRHMMAKYLIGYFTIEQVFRVFLDTNYFERDFQSAAVILPKEEAADRPNPEAQVTHRIDESIKRQILTNAHSRRDMDDYYVVVGSRKESRLLQFAAKITENGSPFKPNDNGRKIFDKAFPRGWKWIYDEQRLQSLASLLEA